MTNTVNQNNAKMDQSNELGAGGHFSLNNYGGKRMSLYVGQLTWVKDE